MNEYVFLPYGHTEALIYAAESLKRKGCKIASAADHTVTHLLLPVPSFDPDGSIKGGLSLSEVLLKLPKNITILGGNLDSDKLSGYTTVDLLLDHYYLAENAAITAHCALKQILSRLPVTLQGCPVLIVGWGRIGKCLAALLRQLGARVCIAARKEADRAMLTALGYEAEDISPPGYGLMRYRVICNTVPTMLLTDTLISNCRPDCIKIDLASTCGIAGNDVIHARGLPNKDAPESSGELIARTALQLTAK